MPHLPFRAFSRIPAFALIGSLMVLCLVGTSRAAVTTITRVNVATGGAHALDGETTDVAISDNGRFVAFSSVAGNLVPNDTNAQSDVFVHDRQTGVTERVSIGDDESEGFGQSVEPTISADGRWVAFTSSAQFAPGFNQPQIYVRDRVNGTTTVISATTEGEIGNSDSHAAAMSPDGRYVAFGSRALNLVPNDTNDVIDIFLRDRDTDNDDIFDEPGEVSTERVGIADDEAQGLGPLNGGDSDAAISADGRFVAFSSYSTNLIPGDTNDIQDAYLRDRVAGTTERISVSTAGAQGDNGSNAQGITADGRFVAFYSLAGNLAAGDTNGSTDIFVRDRQANQTRRVSVSSAGQQAGNFSIRADIAGNGRFVTFVSLAGNLVAGDTNGFPDVFVHDMDTATTERLSKTPAGVQGNSYSGIYGGCPITPDGGSVAFTSYATNFDVGDANGWSDAFVVDVVPSGNTAPLANAGPDQTVLTGGASAQVQLSGSASSDPDGDTLSYAWTRDGNALATGATPNVTLGLGSHLLKLTVSDGNGGEDTDEVTILVETGDPGTFDIEAKAVSSTEIQISYIDPSKVERSIEIQRSTNGGKSFAKLAKLKAVKGSGKKVIYRDTTVLPVQVGSAGSLGINPREYYYRIHIYEPRDIFRRSRRAFCFTLEPPRGLVVDAVSAGFTPENILLRFVNNAIIEDGTEIEIKAPDGRGVLQPTLQQHPGRGLNLLQLQGLARNTYHEFRLRFYNTCGVSSWSEALQFFTPPGGTTRGTALVANTHLTAYILSGNRGEDALLVENTHPSQILQVWVNQPTPFILERGPIPTTGKGFNVDRAPGDLASVDIPPGQSREILLRCRFGSTATGVVNGYWIVYTSAANLPVVTITIEGERLN